MHTKLVEFTNWGKLHEFLPSLVPTILVRAVEKISKIKL